MSVAKTIAKNSFYLYGAEIISKLLTFLLIVFIARKLGTESFGIYNFAFSIAYLFSIFTDLGMTSLYIRNISRDYKKSGKYFSNILFVKLFLAIAVFALMVIAINVINPEVRIIVYSIGLYVIINSFTGFFRGIARTYEKMQYDSLIKIADRVLVCGLGLTILLLGYDLVILGLVFLISAILNLIFSSSIILKKFVKLEWKVNFDFSKNLLKKAIPFGLIGILYVIYIRADITILSILKGNTSVGIYSAAWQIIEALLFIPLVYSVVVFPTASKLFHTSKEKLQELYETSTKYLLILIIPITVILFLVGDQILILLFGEKFAGSILSLKILVFAALLMYLTILNIPFLNAVNKEKTLTKLLGIVVVMNIVLNLTLIPYYNHLGVAIAKLASEIVFISTTIPLVALVRKETIKIFLKVIANGAIIGIILFFFREKNLILLLTSAILIYIVFLYTFSIITSKDIKIIKKILGR